MKKLLAIALIATCLVLSACKKDEPVVETVEGQTKTETETKTATETAEGQTVEKQTETEKRRVDEEFLNEVQTKMSLLNEVKQRQRVEP